MFDDALELQWESMVRAGYSKEQIDLVKQRKKDKENARIYGYMVQQHAWEFDISCDRVDVHLKLARALDAICRRSDAIEILKEAAEEDHLFDSRILMSLAKLLFRDDQKDLSLYYCNSIIKAYLEMQAGHQSEEGVYILVEDALSSYYLSGWIKIHDDNHTDAYKIWSEGHRVIPSCPVLLKQHRKREYWDQDPSHLEEWLLQVCDDALMRILPITYVIYLFIVALID